VIGGLNEFEALTVDLAALNAGRQLERDQMAEAMAKAKRGR
jgi:hypothetical protein